VTQDAISTNNSPLFTSPSSSLSVSFGFDFDAAALSEMDRLEQDHVTTTTPVPHKRRLTGNAATSTPHKRLDSNINNSNTPKTNLFEAQKGVLKGRERISTPIEESGHVLVSPTANLPVFSPVNLLSNSSVSESLGIVEAQRNDEKEQSTGKSR